ncbi:uncharacterized protein BJ171DRAFT_504620 [Polychytrium aggregatum]|uniref:uncharacterized protein n=1 Tax=Polychytrium aggregatum TaxID=110093 RepID=UPI0022FECE59|nr:uncharacterized protein BJ171DRAFT_504620 [Polychytrium aggregatum]KAI9204551.1 hypothetical protein BJ171DRAFT_504620 [Polychytrium aggregatum]
MAQRTPKDKPTKAGEDVVSLRAVEIQPHMSEEAPDRDSGSPQCRTTSTGDWPFARVGHQSQLFTRPKRSSISEFRSRAVLVLLWGNGDFEDKTSPSIDLFDFETNSWKAKKPGLEPKAFGKDIIHPVLSYASAIVEDPPIRGHHLYVFGGCHPCNADDDLFVNQLFSCDPIQGTAAIVGLKNPKLDIANIPTPRISATLTHVPAANPSRDGPGVLVLFGGFGELHTPLNDVYVFNLSLSVWKRVHPKGSAPKGREGHSAVWVPSQRRILFYGGCDSKRRLNSLVYLDVDNWTWIHVSVDGHPPGHSLHTACLYGNKMIVYGGRSGRVTPANNSICCSKLWIYDIDRNSWSWMLTSPKIPARAGHSASVHGNHLLVFGGLTDVPKKQPPRILNDFWSIELEPSLLRPGPIFLNNNALEIVLQKYPKRQVEIQHAPLPFISVRWSDYHQLSPQDHTYRLLIRKVLGQKSNPSLLISEYNAKFTGSLRELGRHRWMLAYEGSEQMAIFNQAYILGDEKYKKREAAPLEYGTRYELCVALVQHNNLSPPKLMSQYFYCCTALKIPMSPNKITATLVPETESQPPRIDLDWIPPMNIDQFKGYTYRVEVMVIVECPGLVKDESVVANTPDLRPMKRRKGKYVPLDDITSWNTPLGPGQLDYGWLAVSRVKVPNARLDLSHILNTISKAFSNGSEHPRPADGRKSGHKLDPAAHESMPLESQTSFGAQSPSKHFAPESSEETIQSMAAEPIVLSQETPSESSFVTADTNGPAITDFHLTGPWFPSDAKTLWFFSVAVEVPGLDSVDAEDMAMEMITILHSPRLGREILDDPKDPVYGTVATATPKRKRPGDSDASTRSKSDSDDDYEYVNSDTGSSWSYKTASVGDSEVNLSHDVEELPDRPAKRARTLTTTIPMIELPVPWHHSSSLVLDYSSAFSSPSAPKTSVKRELDDESESRQLTLAATAATPSKRRSTRRQSHDWVDHEDVVQVPEIFYPTEPAPQDQAHPIFHLEYGKKMLLYSVQEEEYFPVRILFYQRTAHGWGVFVHYIGWNSSWDELIPLNSVTVKHFVEYTNEAIEKYKVRVRGELSQLIFNQAPYYQLKPSEYTKRDHPGIVVRPAI